MPVYTRKGDQGKTCLANGAKVHKNNERVEIYGSVDELNAAIGFSLALLNEAKAEGKASLLCELARIQHLLFEIGAELAAYRPKADKKDHEKHSSKSALASSFLREEAKSLEESIDAMEASVGPMRFFILPGGSCASAALHLARTICRRLERQMTPYLKAQAKDRTMELEEPGFVSSYVYAFINRLSDYLFIAARYANHIQKTADIAWKKKQAT